MPRVPACIMSLALTLLTTTTAGSAEQGPPGDGDQPSIAWGLGIAGITTQQPYKDIDRDNAVLPLLYFETSWVQLMGPRLDFKLPGFSWGEDHALDFTVGVQYDGRGYDSKDAPILNGMDDRKASILAGGAVKWSNPLVNVSAEWAADISGESKGQRITIGLERSFFIGESFMLTPSVAAVWMDKDYVNYYFGVRSSEARAGRRAYFADSTLNADFAMRTDYMIDEHNTVFLNVGYTAFGSEIKDSTLTDRSGESMLMLGYLYRF